MLYTLLHLGRCSSFVFPVTCITTNSREVRTRRTKYEYNSINELCILPKAAEVHTIDRRKVFGSLANIAFLSSCWQPSMATAAADAPSQQVSEEELDALYENPEMPSAPEERSGLVVLRVAEVAQFQEKILRAVVAGDLPPDVQVSPMQFAFGTQILLKNSNVDGNIKLMIQDEIPRKSREQAVKNAVVAMNTLLDIKKYAESINRDFKTEEMLELADMYLKVRVNLNELYEYLPEKEQRKYEGYFVAVTEYEKKIAEGTYNPDIDGVLKFD